MKKFTVTLQVAIDIEVPDVDDIQEVLENMDYSFKSQTEKSAIVDTEILDWEILKKAK